MKLLLLLTILCVSSCGSQTTYRPSIYGHDYINREIITPVTFERISCGERDFQKYASVNLKDLSKLALILQEAKLPKKVRIIIEAFEKEVKTVQKKQRLED